MKPYIRLLVVRTIMLVMLPSMLSLFALGAWAQDAGSSGNLQQQLSRIANQNPASAEPALQSAAALPHQAAGAPPATTAGGQTAAAGSNIGDEAFAAMIRSMMPMTPDQIRTLRLATDTARKTAVYAAGAPPKPVAASRAVDLSPGATPPVIRLATGYITSLVMVDATGAPWPIKSYDLGDPKAYNIQADGNTLMIQATTQFRPANLAVLLKDFDTPIMITLLPTQKVVDYRLDMRIPRMGPNAQQQLSGLPAMSDPMLLNVLDGIKPAGSQSLTVTGGQAKAWFSQDQVYMRTQLTVISPGWVSMVSSADGTHVYLLPKASMVLAIDRGKMVQLQLKGF